MLTVSILCAVFASLSIPAEWRATEIKNLEDRATAKLTRQYKASDRVTIPDGCYLVDEKTGLVIEQPAPVVRERFPSWGGISITPDIQYFPNR